MSKIQNVGLNLGQKIANPFKTSRNITTPNPFKYSNFEGNSLPFADVFEGFEPKKVSKLKMIASSVAGSMPKFHKITEPMVNFVKGILSITGISKAWNYAKNTDVRDIPGQVSNIMNMDIVDIGKGISHSISDLSSNISNGISNSMTSLHADFLNRDVKDISKEISSSISDKMSFLNTDVLDLGKGLSHSISDKMSFLNTDVLDLGKGLSEKWNSLVGSINLNSNRISKDMPVSELKSMWLNEIGQLSEREAL